MSLFHVFLAVAVCSALCDHIMNTLNEMNVLDICRNVLSAGFDTVVNVLLFPHHLRKPPSYAVATMASSTFAGSHRRSK